MTRVGRLFIERARFRTPLGAESAQFALVRFCRSWTLVGAGARRASMRVSREARNQRSPPVPTRSKGPAGDALAQPRRQSLLFPLPSEMISVAKRRPARQDCSAVVGYEAEKTSTCSARRAGLPALLSEACLSGRSSSHAAAVFTLQDLIKEEFHARRSLIAVLLHGDALLSASDPRGARGRRRAEVRTARSRRAWAAKTESRASKRPSLVRLDTCDTPPRPTSVSTRGHPAAPQELSLPVRESAAACRPTRWATRTLTYPFRTTPSSSTFLMCPTARGTRPTNCCAEVMQFRARTTSASPSEPCSADDHRDPLAAARPRCSVGTFV